MKYLLTAILLAVVALSQGQTSDQSAPSIPVDQENARKAKAVLDQMVKALGGDAYLNIQDISQQGRTYSFYHGRPNSLGLEFWRFYKYPDKERVELTKKRDVIYIENGDKGYEITYKGTKAQEDKDLKDYLRRRQYALDWVIRHWLNEPGVALFYEGVNVAEGKQVEQVTIMNSRNQGVTLSIDSDTHLPVKKTYSWRDPTDRERNVESEVWDNYRPIQGVMTPHSVTRYYNDDMSNQRFLNSISYNQGLSDAQFEATVSSAPVRK